MTKSTSKKDANCEWLERIPAETTAGSYIKAYKHVSFSTGVQSTFTTCSHLSQLCIETLRH